MRRWILALCLTASAGCNAPSATDSNAAAPPAAASAAPPTATTATTTPLNGDSAYARAVTTMQDDQNKQAAEKAP